MLMLAIIILHFFFCKIGLASSKQADKQCAVIFYYLLAAQLAIVFLVPT